MPVLSASAFPLIDIFFQAQFRSIDALRRAQGEALGLLGFGPNECDYRVILSGPHWRLRKYAHHLGGTLAAIFCALEQESVRGLVLLGAPLCFAPGSSQFRDGVKLGGMNAGP